MDIIGSAQVVMLGEVALAMLLGGLVGWEREAARKPAGLRTQMLVAGAAALFVGLADVLLARYYGHTHSEMVRSDPIRVLEAIVTGVSFLGAGTIFRISSAANEGEQVKGLTTAASLLMSAGIGVAVGLTQFMLAIGIVVLNLVVLYGLRRLERYFSPREHGCGTRPDADDEGRPQ
ncbi:MgtC/SapB family protein [Chitinolyticbacter albus]|uniref:MgtC/SapB family protein n=1 Tax=Chitinolyticbacter albus TaxID=2961951 RepID=UPI00210C3E12|nr:MgtC/SapB family protein [Chitinolyticbacter albus]